MKVLKVFINYIDIACVIILVFILLFDTILLYLVKSGKPLLKNEYYDFHKRNGFIKVGFLKLIIIIIFISAFVNRTVNSGGVIFGIPLGYGLLVTRLFVDFLKTRN